MPWISKDYDEVELEALVQEPPGHIVVEGRIAEEEGEVFLAPPNNLSANLEGNTPGYFAATVRTEKVVVAE